jgi:small subunit ribosomal protein S20
MANHASAKKATKQAIKRTERNNSVKNKLRTITKKFISAIEAKDAEKAKAEFINAQSEIAVAAKKGVIKKLNADRKISRLSAKLKVVLGEKVIAKAIAKKDAKSKTTAKAESIKAKASVSKGKKK